ncbi:efflux RND transporter periplasmic adaptor subunit [Paenibacillus sp. IB182496]|uniref:Efflux RND transporter periplasmic adaptor subunit n=1 Tax=Paenibacillus sabuli TaxID=2772509 RepID=A0A927BV16_9BACL|nr:efflux RND transporter periplasmic adaptor subunit [Paenibacillus sabuli]MBD2846260.1 efflux RND transporter periplasmic adaptor subunit [Paenibacillus sabuli]
MSMKWWTENSTVKGRLRRGALAFTLGAALLAASGCALLPDEPDEEVLPEITPPQISQKPEYEVTTTTLETKVSGTGKLMSTQEETIYFTLEGKRLKTLAVELGDAVQAGQLIGELDVEDMQKELTMQKLQFRTNEIEMKELLRKRDEMDAIEFEKAVIAFEEARQQIVDRETELGKAALYAPFAGTVVSLPVQKGDAITAYEPVAVIADTSDLAVAVSISKERLEQVAVGMPVTVDINNAGSFTGKVKSLPVPKEDSGNNGQNPGNNAPERPEHFLLVVLDEALPEDVTRGTPLSASVITKRTENAIVIPSAALRSIGSRTYVQVADEQGKREVDVAVGQQTATQVEILEGLTPGQKVVGR